MGKSNTSGAGAGSTLPEYKESANVRSEGLNVYRYPTDVGSDEYPNYIMFNIVKREGDIGNTETIGDATASNALYGIAPEVSKQNRSDLNTGLAGVMGVISAATGGFEAGSDIVKDAGKFVADKLPAGGEVVKAGATVAGNAVGLALGVAAGITVGVISQNRDRVTLKTTIALHLNNKPSVSYKAQWADKELGVIGGAGNVFGKMKDAVSGRSGVMDNAEGLMSAAGEAIKGIGGAAATMALKKVNDTPLKAFGDVQSFFEAGTGQAINPFKAQLFKNMEFRTFSFDYVFLPRNKTEYDSVQTIIKTFKRYMHPKLGEENFFLGYPAEFNITYFHKNGPNHENIFKLSSCALTDLKVEYGGADFVTFKGTSGAPTEIAMSLSFLELELLTEERILDGY